MGDLTDKELKNLKPRAKLYKVTDRDGMHAAVTPTGVVSFRYRYRVNGRQEVLTIGRYSAEAARNLTRAPDALEYGMDVSLAEARTLLARARRQVERGESPSKAKVEKRTASAAALTFGGWAEAYFKHKADPKSGAERLADSTLSMRRSVYDRAIAAELSKLKLGEVTPQRLKRLCDEVKEKRGPAVAVHVREVVLLVFRHAQGCGLDVGNPAESIRTSAIATFEPRERALSPSEVRAVLAALDHVAAAPDAALGGEVRSVDRRSQVGVHRRHMEGNRLRGRALDDPGRAHEGRQGPCRPAERSGSGYLDGVPHHVRHQPVPASRPI